MNNKNIWRIAMEQSATDFNCSATDFIRDGYQITSSELKEGRKKCYQKPLLCRFAYYGCGFVASVDERLQEFMEGFLKLYSGFRCFDTPQLILLNSELEKYSQCVCHIAEFFLPDLTKEVSINPDLEVVILSEEEITTLYRDDRFPMALSYSGPGDDKKDVLAAVGYLNGILAGVAGASNDCETMWQVGIDVLPEYRRQGVAATLTRRLTEEILDRGKVPYYCTAWSNIASKNNALKSGYKTAWVELAAKEIKVAMNMIRKEEEV